MIRKLRRFVAIGTLVLLGGYLFVRFFVGDVYHVGTRSMEPTIWGGEGGGEWVFVRFDRTRPARQALVVATVPGESTPVVKRVAGLPGESVRISDGDLLVDRVRLRPSEPRPPLVPIFDDRWQRLDERFRIDAERARHWRKDGDAWLVDATNLEPESDAAMLVTDHALLDDYLGPDHEHVAGTTPVHDARFECRVRFDDPVGRVRVVLREAADTFELVLARAADGAGSLTIVRTRPEIGATTPDGTTPTDGAALVHEPLVTTTLALPLGTWLALAFENRDDTLRAECDGLSAPLVHTYKGNSPVAPGTEATEALRTDRVAFGADAGRLAFRALRILRDVDYTSDGRVGVANELLLGPDEVFLLGDLSSHSEDGREWGPVPLDALRGRPVAVVWPPSRWRKLAR